MRKPTKILVIILIAGIFFGAGFSYGQNHYCDRGQEIIEICRVGIHAHQHYVDNPELCNGYSGSPEYNQQWVNNYRLILEYVEGK